MKIKSHQFLVTVKTTALKPAARNALLCAFAKRSPDGCEFRVSNFHEHKLSQSIRNRIARYLGITS